MNSLANAQQALIDRLNDNMIPGYTKREVKYPNAPFREPKNRSWLRVTTTTEPALNVADSGEYQRTYGIFVIDCFYPKDDGSKQQLQDINSLIAIYNNQEFNGVKCHEAYPQIIGEDGDWYNVQLNVNFYFEGY